jgi:hypothetical protein
MVIGYGLDGRRIEVPVPVGRDFSPFGIVQTSSGAHPDSYPMGTGGFPSRGLKRQRRKS